MSPAAAVAAVPALLEVRGLRTRLQSLDGPLTVVDGVDFQLSAGETLGLVGESGSGKTMTALSLLGLLPPGARVVGGTAHYQGRDLLQLDVESLRRVRGRDIAIVFQEPQASLDPVRTCGDVLRETLREHTNLSGAAIAAAAADLLRRVHLPEPVRVAASYPHELSGGMCQRVALALALVGQPRLLIADEVTRGLDLTVQEQILDLLAALQADDGLGVLLVTHDLAVVAQRASRLAVMVGGRIVEAGPVRRVFHAPGHPYTRALLRARPGLLGSRQRLSVIPGPGGGSGPAADRCPFLARCPERIERCHHEAPPLRTHEPGHTSLCFVDPPGRRVDS